MTRARHEHQIRSFGKPSHPVFKGALAQMIAEHGLDWLTDDQIADIREYLIDGAWFTHKLNRENRKRLASRERAVA